MGGKHFIGLICRTTIALGLFWSVGLPLGAHVPESESLSAADRRNARESIILGTSNLRLTANVWRDFMPAALLDESVPGEDAVAPVRGIIATVKIFDKSGKPLPKSLQPKMVYLVQGERIWQTSAIQESRDESTPSTLDLAIQQGPQWEPQTFVDVFVRIAEGKGVSHLLVIRHQVIEVTI
jgi:hypothetical protein